MVRGPRPRARSRIELIIVATYIEQHRGAPPTVKQHLAAIRMLFDWLVTGQVLPVNPAWSVRGPKHVVKKGKTPVLTAAEARTLLDSIDVSTSSGLRDRALIGLMVFSFARVSAAVGMDVEDYFQQGKRWWFRLHEKGGKRHDVPAHHNAEAYMDAYLESAGLAGEKNAPLFRTVDRHGRLTASRLTRNDALRMVKRRAWAAWPAREPSAVTVFVQRGSLPTWRMAARSKMPRRSRPTSRRGRRSFTTGRGTRSRWTRWSGFRFNGRAPHLRWACMISAPRSIRPKSETPKAELPSACRTAARYSDCLGYSGR